MFAKQGKKDSSRIHSSISSKNISQKSKRENDGKTIIPSSYFLKYLKEFPDTMISKNVMKYGYEQYIHSSGHFAQALARGDLKEAWRRADFKNRKILMTITGQSAQELEDYAYGEQFPEGHINYYVDGRQY